MGGKLSLYPVNHPASPVRFKPCFGGALREKRLETSGFQPDAALPSRVLRLNWRGGVLRATEEPVPGAMSPIQREPPVHVPDVKIVALLTEADGAPEGYPWALTGLYNRQAARAVGQSPWSGVRPHEIDRFHHRPVGLANGTPCRRGRQFYWLILVEICWQAVREP